MKRKLLIRDLTLRDGQQSAFATRMNQSQVDRVLPYYKDANFYAMEVWGRSCSRLRDALSGRESVGQAEKISDGVEGVSKLTALSRGRNLYGMHLIPMKSLTAFKNAVSNELSIMRIFDALNDVDNKSRV